MKYLLFLILQLGFTSAQTDTLEALKYYPLQNGNYWEYEVHDWEFPYTDDSSFYSVKIIGDTVLSNDRSYKILTYKSLFINGTIYNIYERIDSSTANLYRYINDSSFSDNEYLCDSLLANVNDYFAGSYTNFLPEPGNLSTLFQNEYEDEVLNYFTSIKEFDDQSRIPQITYSFAKGLGFIHSLGCEFICSEIVLRFARIDSVEYGTQITKTENIKNTRPPDFKLYQNHPNPFNPTTNIEYSIPHPAFVTLKIYDALGNEIAILVNAEKPAGRYNVDFEGSKLSSGIYFYVLRAGDFIKSRKMLFIK